MAQSKAPIQTARSADFVHALPAVRARSWLFLAGIAVFATAATLWACLSSIPVTVESHGILLHPTGVAQVESTTFGEVIELKVGRREQVKKEQVLAVLALPNLQPQLELARERLSTLQSLDADATQLEQRQLADEQQLAAEKKTSTESTIHSLETLVASQRSTQQKAIVDRKKQIAESQQRSDRMLLTLETQQKETRDLLSQQLATNAQLAQIETAVLESLQSRALLDERANELDLQQLRSQQALLEQEANIEQLRLSVREIDLSLGRLRSQLEAERLKRIGEIEAQKKSVMSLETQFDEKRYLRSPCDGTVLELSIEAGKTIQPGQTIGAISREPSDGQNDLQVTAFFSLADGKQIPNSAHAFVTPTTVKRERFGSIRADVDEISDFPISTQEAIRVVGNREVLKPLASMGGVLQVRAKLRRKDDDNMAYDWSSIEPAIPLTAGTSVSIQVVVERRRPISYVIPFLHRSVFGPSKGEELGGM